MFFLFGSNRHLSNGPIRFVTRRTACAIALGSATLALMAGAAFGALLAEQTATTMHAPATDEIQHAYVVDELGKLNASVSQIDPRIARLAAQIGALRDLQAHLKTPSRHPEQLDDQAPLDDAGGPAFPPRPCGATARRPAQASLDSARHQVACIADTLQRLEHEVLQYSLALTALPGRSPVAGGRFVSSFGNRLDPFDRRLRFHSGIDFAAQTGTPVRATAGGRVTFAGLKTGYGLMVEIDHGNELVTRYGHASRLAVHEGDLVLPLQRIADVGSTGRSTGPHLHFEVLERGEAVDPLDYLGLFPENPDG